MVLQSRLYPIWGCGRVGLGLRTAWLEVSFLDVYSTGRSGSCPPLPFARLHLLRLAAGAGATLWRTPSSGYSIGGQRQWNDLAIARATPVRFALLALVTLIVDKQLGWRTSVRQAAWYKKALPTFLGALAQVRRCLWRQINLMPSTENTKRQEIPTALFAHLGELLAYAA